MKSERAYLKLKDCLTLSNGKNPETRTENGEYIVFGSNGPIARSSLANTGKNTIIIGRVGSYCGSLAFSKNPCWVTDNAIKGNVKEGFDPYYVYNVLRTVDIHALRGGSGQPLVNQTVLGEIPIPNLPLVEQQNISKFFEALDNLTEELEKQNSTFESIAQTIFKSWFVNFDPVHAKAAGREPEGLSAEIAGLFPSEFDESELGLIPKGWEVQSLDKYIDYLNGLALQKFPALGIETDLPVLKIAQLRAGKTDPSVMANVSSKPAYIIRDGDVVFSWSGTLEIKLWTGGDCALNQHLFKVSSSTLPKWLCYLATLSHLDNFRAIAESKQTTMGHIQRRHLTEAKIILPPTESLNAFNSVMSPITDTVINNSVLARTLGSIRDELLPRLISGKIRIEEAEEAFADVMPLTEKQVA